MLVKTTKKYYPQIISIPILSFSKKIIIKYCGQFMLSIKN